MVIDNNDYLISGNVRPVLPFFTPFAPIHAQDAQIRSAAHRVLAAALLLLEQFHNIILMLQKNSNPQNCSTKEDSQIFLRKIALKILF
jgi:hypothetical protein